MTLRRRDDSEGGGVSIGESDGFAGSFGYAARAWGAFRRCGGRRGCRRWAARCVERVGGDCAANRRAARHCERIGNCARTRAPCVRMSCQFPNERSLPTHVPGPQGTADRDQGIACEWLEAVELDRSLSRNTE